ncbi:phytanoyl-CoA dioxygenase family protein [Flavobacterium jejuense]|uniref:Phytanoyl-CoA dioxygenase family protein n=1 Tax=Flavobacterium jejuense TaxID=1544455 RepID=A0ABX0IYT0_9FLAO|nr:phytanoyl-CoA dioxygenase family protein [Flavobacterium jejuense]NHN27161.1 phytanoyl-CoA dioxygenase family protein [Flavobacterium jejuense]
MNKYITSEQFNQFKEEGFVKITDCLSTELLKKLQLFIDEVVADENDTQKVTLQVDDKKFVTNIQLLGYKNNLTCLELLASPFLLEVAQTICGADFFCLQEFAVIKNLGDNLPVLWHQDMIHQRTGYCFMVGVYLDDANTNDGALKVIPKSHISNKNICDVIKEEYVEIPMQAGDILVHDMMLVHSSEPLQVNQKRRVVYFEFLSATQVEKEGIYSNELVANRTNLLNVALSYYKQQNPLLQQFHWKSANRQHFETVEAMRVALDEIYAIPIQGKPSNYCFEM